MTPELLAMLTPEERAAWALCEAATPGPWVSYTLGGETASEDGPAGFVVGPTPAIYGRSVGTSPPAPR